MTVPGNPDRPTYAMLNGEVVPFSEARISIMAPGLTFAVTVFEGFRAYWNERDAQLYVFRMAEHLRRQAFSMALIELDAPPSEKEIAAQIIQILLANQIREDSYIRSQAYVDDWGDMTATGPVGSSVICRKRPRTGAFESGKHFATSSWRRNAEDASPPRIKATANYLNSRLAGLEAQHAGFGGAVILNRDGTVAEGPGGCIFLRRGETLITPGPTDGILESVTRDTLLRLARDNDIEVEVRSVGRTELYLADEAFYCGTGQELTPMLSVDRKPVGSGEPGPVTRLLQSLYDDVVRGRNERYADWLTPVWPDGA